jgi:hypothetical protein
VIVEGGVFDCTSIFIDIVEFPVDDDKCSGTFALQVNGRVWRS